MTPEQQALLAYQRDTQARMREAHEFSHWQKQQEYNATIHRQREADRLSREAEQRRQEERRRSGW